MVKDELDWRIIDILQINARLSFAEIGRKVGLSASAIAERIQRLEESEVIESYSARLKPKKIGYGLSVYISMSFRLDRSKLFISKIDDFPEIIDCSRITGNDCLMMRAMLKDTEHLEKFIDRLVEYGNPTTSVILSDVRRNNKLECVDNLK